MCVETEPGLGEEPLSFSPSRTLGPSVSKGRVSIVCVDFIIMYVCHGLWASEPSVAASCVPSHGPGTVKAEMLEMYTQEDLLILCVRLAVLLAVTLTVPVVLFPVSGGEEGLGSEGIWMDGQREETWAF